MEDNENNKNQFKLSIKVMEIQCQIPEEWLTEEEVI